SPPCPDKVAHAPYPPHIAYRPVMRYPTPHELSSPDLGVPPGVHRAALARPIEEEQQLCKQWSTKAHAIFASKTFPPQLSPRTKYWCECAPAAFAGRIYTCTAWACLKPWDARWPMGASWATN